MLTNEIMTKGFAIIPGVYSAEESATAADKLTSDFENESGSDVLSSRGSVYAARNLIDTAPWLTVFWNRPPLVDVLRHMLGDEFGLVRILFFDKPSDRSWSLPFHKDMTIAVRDNSIPSGFSKPTVKAGVPHVEASTPILNQMLALRIHLDEVTAQNGPLQVIPGSHHAGKVSQPSKLKIEKILVAAGDVLAMRPLISHASGHTEADGPRRRRVLHYEFCGTQDLPGGYEWHRFISWSDVSQKTNDAGPSH